MSRAGSASMGLGLGLDWGALRPAGALDLSQAVLFSNDPALLEREGCRVPLVEEHIGFFDEGKQLVLEGAGQGLGQWEQGQGGRREKSEGREASKSSRRRQPAAKGQQESSQAHYARPLTCTQRSLR
jgi:hypothetical protein